MDSPIHDYVLNEMGCALMYPNVRGSSGYGKQFMAADDVEKREDSVKYVLILGIKQAHSSLIYHDMWSGILVLYWTM